MTADTIEAAIRAQVTESGTVPVWMLRQALRCLARIETGAQEALAQARDDEALTMPQRAGIAEAQLQIAGIRAGAAFEVLGRYLPD